MCLSKIEKFKPNKYGYKILNKNISGYTSPLFHRVSKSYRLNKWHRAISIVKAASETGGTYKTGFHMYNSLKDAKKSRFLKHYPFERVICRVEYENYITGCGDGTDAGRHSKQIVAIKMKIIKEMKCA